MSEPTSPVKADRSTSAASPKATAAATTTPPSILTASKPPNKPPAATVEDASDSEDDQPVSSSTAVKGKGKATENEGARASAGPAAAAAPPAHDWQAVWSPAQNAYYFYNTKTLETTWTNPLANSDASATAGAPSSAGGSSRADSPPWDPSVETLPTAGAATTGRARAALSHAPSFSYGGQGTPSSTGSYAIDQQQQPGPSIHPGLAYLVPPSYNPLGSSGSSGGGGATGVALNPYTAQARFNSRTGRYEADPSRAPEHLSDFARMRRQNEAFFDQAEWERQREAEFEQQQRDEAAGGGGGSKRKRATREEVAAYKAKKEAKRKKNNAWLRS